MVWRWRGTKENGSKGMKRRGRLASIEIMKNSQGRAQRHSEEVFALTM